MRKGGHPNIHWILVTRLTSLLPLFQKEGRKTAWDRAPISILLRREDEELGPGPARAGYRVSGSGLAWEAVSIGLVLSWSYFINTHQNKARLLLQP